jgi:hypothetical protein
MNSIDKKTLKELRKKHKDVLENPAIEKAIQFKRDNEENLGYNPINYPVMSDEAYCEKAKAILPYLSKKFLR